MIKDFEAQEEKKFRNLPLAIRRALRLNEPDVFGKPLARKHSEMLRDAVIEWAKEYNPRKRKIVKFTPLDRRIAQQIAESEN